MVGAVGNDRAARLAKAFNDAVRLHVAGRLGEAATLYEGLLRQLPKNPDILDYYGTLRHQQGDHRSALSLVGRSIDLRPLAAATRNRLGAVHRALGDRAAAGRAFRRAVLTDPRLAEPAVNLAALLSEGDQPERALAWCRRVLAADPGSFDARMRRAMALNALGRFEEALRDLGPLAQAQPSHPEILLQLASARAGTGDSDGAIDATRRGVVSAPTAYELYSGLTTGRGLLAEGDEFVAWARRALILKRREARLWSNLAVELYRAAEAETAFHTARRAAVLEPALEPALLTLVRAGFQCERTAVARKVARRGRMLYPSNLDIAVTLAEIEFVVGDLRDAWDLHELRIGRPNFRPRLACPPLWLGPGTESGPLLVASEQGVGDEVVFLSCVPDLLNTVRVPVVIEVDRRIVPVIQRTFPTATVVPRQLAPGDSLGQFFDYADVVERYGLRHCVFAGSLPRLFRPDRDHPTPQGGYLRPDPDRVDRWRDRLARFKPNLTVGVVWRSALMTKYRARFHADILDWAPVFRTPGCTFVNLMHGDVAPELERLREREGVEVHRLEGADLWEDIDDLMALLSALDVVVATRTANCAFAAAVGTPTIRAARSYLRIADGRDHFFSNMWPTVPRDHPFDSHRAAENAARLLRERVASR